jgi:hypothetical protein
MQALFCISVFLTFTFCSLISQTLNPKVQGSIPWWPIKKGVRFSPHSLFLCPFRPILMTTTFPAQGVKLRPGGQFSLPDRLRLLGQKKKHPLAPSIQKTEVRKQKMGKGKRNTPLAPLKGDVSRWSRALYRSHALRGSLSGPLCGLLRTLEHPVEFPRRAWERSDRTIR